MTERTTASGGKVSEVGTNMEVSDEMMERASVPNLASLFQRGKEAGLIKPGKEYGSSA